MSGIRANCSGRIAEKVLDCVLRQRGLEVKNQYLAGKSIYGGELKIDLFVRGLIDFPKGLAIESKWQDVRGTADEKLPYLVANIQQCYPCPAVIVAHGGGIRPGAIKWVKSQINDKLIAVFSLEEFISWAMRSLK